MRRLGWIFGALAIGLFWLFGAAVAHHARGWPRPQAVMRYVPFMAKEAVWEYRGPRPREGERLVLFGRAAGRYDSEELALVAYLAPEGKPPDGEPWRERPIRPADYFSHGALVLPEWPSGQRLYVGVERRFAEALIFWERGEWPSAPLAPVPLIRRGRDARFNSNDHAAFGPIDVRMVPEDSALWRQLTAPAGEVDARMGLRGPGVGRWGWLAAGMWLGIVLVGARELRGWRTRWMAWAVLNIALGWHVVSHMAPSQDAWTAFHTLRWGAPWFLLSVLGVQLLTLPIAAAMVGRVACCLWRRIERGFAGGVVYTMVLVAMLTVLVLGLFHWRVRGAYGDGIGALVSPYAFGERHNPLTSGLFYLYRPWHPLLQETLAAWQGNRLGIAINPDDVMRVSWFVSLMGPLYLIGSLGIAGVLGRSRRERLVIWLVLLLAKPAATQFGYLEVYGPALGLMMVALWLLLRAHRRGGDVIVPSAAAFASYLGHFATGAMLPWVVLLWARRGWAARLAPRWLLPRVLATGLACLALFSATLSLFWIAKYDGDRAKFEEFIPHYGLAWLKGPIKLAHEEPFLRWTGELHYQHVYTLLSLSGLTQSVGGFIFAGGPVVLLLALVVARRWRRVFGSVVGWAAVLSAGLITVLAARVFNFFPQPRDWDLFCIPTMLQLVALLALATHPGLLHSATRRHLLWLLLVYTAWDFAFWMGYNLYWGPAVTGRITGGF